jgi:hypothetical protein
MSWRKARNMKIPTTPAEKKELRARTKEVIKKIRENNTVQLQAKIDCTRTALAVWVAKDVLATRAEESPSPTTAKMKVRARRGTVVVFDCFAQTMIVSTVL